MSGEKPQLGWIGLDAAQAQLPPPLYGSKASELAGMTALGLPVPPAFVLPTALCGPILSGDAKARTALREGLAEGVARL